MTAMSPVTKTARQAQIAGILANTRVRSQEELAGLLAQRGIRVAQATLSRDLEELGAVRLREAGGGLVYALPGEPGGPGSRPGGVGADIVMTGPDVVVSVGEGRHGEPGTAEGQPGLPGAGRDQPGQSGQAQGGPGGPGRGRGRAGQAAVAEGQPGGPGRGRGEPGREPGRPGHFGSLTRIAGELLVSAEASANLVVLRTPAGGAQLLASAIDHAGWLSILGTVAGDDTVLVITRDPAGGDEVAQALLRLAERRT